MRAQWIISRLLKVCGLIFGRNERAGTVAPKSVGDVEPLSKLGHCGHRGKCAFNPHSARLFNFARGCRYGAFQRGLVTAFVRAGCKRLGFSNSEAGTPSVMARQTGYIAAAKKMDLEVSVPATATPVTSPGPFWRSARPGIGHFYRQCFA